MRTLLAAAALAAAMPLAAHAADYTQLQTARSKVGFSFTQMGVTPWASIWIYWVPQLLAGIIAAFVFRAAHPGE